MWESDDTGNIIDAILEAKKKMEQDTGLKPRFIDIGIKAHENMKEVIKTWKGVRVRVFSEGAIVEDYVVK